MQPDPLLKSSIDRLRDAGWEVMIASAGCAWYIDLLLAQADVKVDVHANPVSSWKDKD